MKVYVCFSGEYEQRYAKAVFSSQAIANEYSEDVDEFELWDRLPQPQVLHEASGVFPPGDVAGRYGYEISGKWAVKRDFYQADNYHVQRFSEERVCYWYRNRPELGIHVSVKGGVKEDVERRFRELQAEVESGRTPEAQGERRS